MISISKELAIRLLGFRWKHDYMDAIHCSSCGAKASDDADKFQRYEECSKNCPWRQLEEALINDQENSKSL